MTISTNGTCWYPDGSTVTTDVPCNTTAAANGDATACCGAEALCMANGLCYDWGILSRGSCTDSSWGEGCAQYCTTRMCLFSLVAFYLITPDINPLTPDPTHHPTSEPKEKDKPLQRPRSKVN